MELISPQSYKGNTYIKLGNLPINQKNQLTDWLATTEIIELKVEHDAIDYCVNYADYLFWLENYYDSKNSYESEI